jgi:hypothetical protein
MVLEALAPAARSGQLAVDPATAAKEIVATSSGVVLTLIQQPAEERDLNGHSVSRETAVRVGTGAGRIVVIGSRIRLLRRFHVAWTPGIWTKGG